jgi:hypothetical protein
MSTKLSTTVMTEEQLTSNFIRFFSREQNLRQDDEPPLFDEISFQEDQTLKDDGVVMELKEKSKNH